MLLAVISFLLMIVSIPMLSARLMKFRFSTSAITFLTPNRLATIAARIFVSERPVTATKASMLLNPSSIIESILRPSSLIISVFSSVSVSL